MWDLLRERTGHRIVPPVPSLFTFQLSDKALCELSGISVPQAFLKIANTELEASGPLLITHRGLSGPAVLRLSAWGARILADMGYQFTLVVSWIVSDEPEAREELREFCRLEGKKRVKSGNPWGLPQNLWKYLASEVDDSLRWADMRSEALDSLAKRCAAMELRVSGKNTFKEEFVTAGGIDLKEVDFRTMESKRHKGLYFAGEVLDIDAITGGFNFQAAWTGGWLAAMAIMGSMNAPEKD
jgi:predicted Rossmann fold flavoprotein